MFVFCAYQMMFAIITPALITGAFANRVTFKAYMLFLTAWLVLVYFPFVHMIWGGGMLANWGVLDFAGGIVVHNIAGIAALASVLYVGKRRIADRGPHSIPLVALGTGLLWFGWYGFNAGSEFRVDSVTAVAFLNTDLAASFAAIAWLGMDWMTTKRPKFLGLLTGAVAGLATITPAAGYVSPATACLIGIVSGVVCFYAVALKNKFGWDDALDVWGVHGVGGALGIVLCGVFATTAFNPAGVDGLLRGNPHFFFIQVGAVMLSSIWAFVFTYGMLWLIDRITAVKVDEAGEAAGLDQSLHGEAAYWKTFEASCKRAGRISPWRHRRPRVDVQELARPRSQHRRDEEGPRVWRRQRNNRQPLPHWHPTGRHMPARFHVAAPAS